MQVRIRLVWGHIQLMVEKPTGVGVYFSPNHFSQKAEQNPVPGPLPARVRFGGFECNLRSGELRGPEQTLRLSEKPFRVLAILLEHEGELVTREELQSKLWASDTVVDFEHGINTAIRKLRQALGDSAETPVFIETLPRRGYRFIAPMESGETDVQPASIAEIPSSSTPSRLRTVSGRKLTALAIAFLLLLIAGLLGYGRWKTLHAHSAVAIRSLAVLPLQDIPHDVQTEYFTDGMTEALITDLGKVSHLRVISRQSMMRYENTTKSVPEIAKELNVDGLVEGSVALSNQQVRITVQLISTNPERHLWAESYQRDRRDVLSVQQEVAREIASHIVQITGGGL